MPTIEKLSLRQTLDNVGTLKHIPEVRRLAEWVHEAYDPRVYATEDHVDMSCWWGFIHDRGSYESDMHRSLYFFHEYCHMMINGMGQINPDLFAVTFDRSERYASYLSEVWLYLRDPSLADLIPFPKPMLWEHFTETGVRPEDLDIGVSYRSSVIDQLLEIPAEYDHETTRLVAYKGNLEWAKTKFYGIPAEFRNPLGDEPYYAQDFFNLDPFPGKPSDEIIRWNIAIMETI